MKWNFGLYFSDGESEHLGTVEVPDEFNSKVESLHEKRVKDILSRNPGITREELDEDPFAYWFDASDSILTEELIAKQSDFNRFCFIDYERNKNMPYEDCEGETKALLMRNLPDVLAKL